MNFLKRFFSGKKEIKKFSDTTTDATEGSNSKADLNPEIKNIVENISSNNNISNEQLNKLIGFYFNKPPIEHHLYKLDKSYSDGMCFEINAINTITNKDSDVENIVLNMREVTYSIELSISISIKDFHEFFEALEFKVTTNT